MKRSWREFFASPGTRMQGCIGPCTSTYVAGWADWGGPAPRALVVRLNGATVGRVTPWLARPDVVTALGLTGARGFFFSFPRPLREGDRVDVLDETEAPLQASPFVYRLAPLPTGRDFAASRAAIAAMFLRGEGLEIGAFTQPTDLPHGARADYYDRFPPEKLREAYDEACGRPLVEPKYWGDAQTMDGLPEGAAFDFVIANHVIEHLEDPIAFLKRVALIVKPGGRALVIAPNKRFSFDAPRDLTPFEHLVEEHLNDPRANRSAHYLEWVRRIDGLAGEAAEKHARRLEDKALSIHFHVWDENAFVAFVGEAIVRFALPLSLLFSYSAHHEIAVVVERASA